MGRPKLLLPWGNSTVIETVLDAWLASKVDRVVVVVHPGDDDLARACDRSRVEIVRPAAAPPQMKDSVRCALEWLTANCRPRDDDCWLLAPADLPTLDPAAIDATIAAHEPPRHEILAPTWNGRRGHPVLFPWVLAQRVSELSADQGVNQLLSEHPVREIRLATPPILDDMDTPENYQRLHDRCHPPGGRQELVD